MSKWKQTQTRPTGRGRIPVTYARVIESDAEPEAIDGTATVQVDETTPVGDWAPVIEGK